MILVNVAYFHVGSVFISGRLKHIYYCNSLNAYEDVFQLNERTADLHLCICSLECLTRIIELMN